MLFVPYKSFEKIQDVRSQIYFKVFSITKKKVNFKESRQNNVICFKKKSVIHYNR